MPIVSVLGETKAVESMHAAGIRTFGDVYTSPLIMLGISNDRVPAITSLVTAVHDMGFQIDGTPIKPIPAFGDQRWRARNVMELGLPPGPIATKLWAAGVETIGQLASMSRAEIVLQFGEPFGARFADAVEHRGLLLGQCTIAQTTSQFPVRGQLSRWRTIGVNRLGARASDFPDQHPADVSTVGQLMAAIAFGELESSQGANAENRRRLENRFVQEVLSQSAPTAYEALARRLLRIASDLGRLIRNPVFTDKNVDGGFVQREAAEILVLAAFDVAPGLWFDVVAQSRESKARQSSPDPEAPQSTDEQRAEKALRFASAVRALGAAIVQAAEVIPVVDRWSEGELDLVRRAGETVVGIGHEILASVGAAIPVAEVRTERTPPAAGR